MNTDTIAAIATALSDAGIGIIRVSGPEAVPVVNSIFYNGAGKKILCEKPSHTVTHGYIVYSESGEKNVSEEEWKKNILDEVMVVLMKAPHSYTMEDTVEINCHGGVMLLQKVLQLVIRSGARLAEPGEFTQRAFLNGRIDLSQAEAVMDVIHSQSEMALSSSMEQLTGKLAAVIRNLREEILYEVAFIESALDDPEHISLEGYEEKLFEKCNIFIDRITKLIATAEDGRLIREGIKTVILGRPNAGKSSLLNAILGQERAIVTQVPGTTRDILQETIKLKGITLHIVDTAGIRYTEDIVERIGVDKARQYADQADLVLFVIDGSERPDEQEREIISLIEKKNVIVIINKTDLPVIITEEEIKLLFSDNRQPEIVRISAREGIGLDQLEKQIEKIFFSGVIKENQEIVITNLRHKEALENAYQSLLLVKQSLASHMPEDFYSIDLMGAYTALGFIIGEEVEDDLVREIFSKFCMGK